MTKHTLEHHARLSVAPMMDWTDRHCRYLHRVISSQTLLYTEMVTAPALVRGGALHLLDYHQAEHPVAVQLGGSDPVELGEATAIACQAGYDEVNLNCGCPSDRVQSGTFGAVMMKDPDLVAQCVRQMIDQSSAEVTVKCRIGVDDQDPHVILPDFIEKIADAGIKRIQIHARKAWLSGLSPKENRDIPPLDYDLVYAMKERFPALHISLNGGLQSLAQAKTHLDGGLDGVMIGRAAYQTPFDVLGQADQLLFGSSGSKTAFDVVQSMRPYIATHLANGGKLAQVTRHMLGLFQGKPGARHWRRSLSENAHRAGAGLEVVDEALGAFEAAH